MNMSALRHWGVIIAFAVVVYLAWTLFVSKLA